LNVKYIQTDIHQFIASYVKSKGGELTEESDEIFSIKYPKQNSSLNEEGFNAQSAYSSSTDFTYEPSVAREKKAQLITIGSPSFQQILKDCLAHGTLCQIALHPKGELQDLLKRQFKDLSATPEECLHATVAEQNSKSICLKNQQCYHQINNSKILSIKIIKEEPQRYFLFYYLATFQNKLRSKNEELIILMTDDEGNLVADQLTPENISKNAEITIENSKTRITTINFNELKAVADQTLDALLNEKLVLFDLPLNNQRKSKVHRFDKRLRRTIHEQMISKKQDFSDDNWQANYELLLKREEESLLTSVSVKFLNLLIVNTVQVRFEVILANKSTIQANSVLGISHAPEVSCPICRQKINEGYATQDALYVCKNCMKQSIDTAKIYSTKSPMRLDEKLNEYFEQDEGFVCSVCGKRHSRLLEFKCSFDNSSVCIYHYELCDVCGKVFSKLKLSHTEEFKQQLCPTHAQQNK